MTDSDRIDVAEAEVERARERLLDTIQELAQMLEPRRLMRELWQDAKVKGADLAEEAVDAVKARPLTATGVAAAVAMFLAREPIADLAGKLIGGSKAKKTKRATAKQTPERMAQGKKTASANKRPRKRKSAATAAASNQTEKA